MTPAEAVLTHATVRGLERLRYGAARTFTPQLILACDGSEIADDHHHYGKIACGGSPTADDIPTCPACAVLRDAALEQSEVT